MHLKSSITDIFNSEKSYIHSDIGTYTLFKFLGAYMKFQIFSRDLYVNIPNWKTNYERKNSDRELTFLLFLTVTRLTPGIGFMPSFSMALRLFFSLLLCFDLPLASPACPANRSKFVTQKREAMMQNDA